MRVAIRSIEYYLPKPVVTNEQLAEEFPEWSIEKIQDKTGIFERHIAEDNECASDLAYNAAQLIFQSGVCAPTDIDYLLLCTQSPDYLLPTTACLLQQKLNIPQASGALDFNLGCSGFVYGIGLAHGLLQTGQANRVLLITAETYSKLIHPRDKSVRTLFGDAAAATVLENLPAEQPLATSYVYGTDGRGASNLIVPAGGSRSPSTTATGEAFPDSNGSWRSQNDLFMDGAEIFTFTLRAVPAAVNRLLAQTGKHIDDVDLFVFHQANQYMLEHLRKKLSIPTEKFCICLQHCGNTVSSTIPIALKHASLTGQLKDGQLVMLVGFGVGYSWGATFLRWPSLGY